MLNTEQCCTTPVQLWALALVAMSTVLTAELLGTMLYLRCRCLGRLWLKQSCSISDAAGWHSTQSAFTSSCTPASAANCLQHECANIISSRKPDAGLRTPYRKLLLPSARLTQASPMPCQGTSELWDCQDSDKAWEAINTPARWAHQAGCRGRHADHTQAGL